MVKPANAERFIRFVSRRGAPNTVTFSHTGDNNLLQPNRALP